MYVKKKTYGMLDMITFSFKVSPFYSAVFTIQRILSAVLPTIQIFVTAYFVNTAIAIINEGRSKSTISLPIIMLAAIMLYNVLIGVIMNFVHCRSGIYYKKVLRPEIIEKQARLEYRYIENQETADLINRVCPPFDANVKDMFMRILDVVDTIVYILGIVITLFTQVWPAAAVILASSVPIMYIATKAGQKSYEADKEMSKVDRRAGYLSDVLKSRDAVEERSVYGYTENLNEQYVERYTYARKYRLKVSAKNFIKQKMGGIVCSVLSIITMLFMLTPVTKGNISYGMFIALMGAIFGLSGRLSWGVNWLIQDLSRKREYLKDLTKFMLLDELEDAVDYKKEGMAFKKLEFKNVSFKYPGTEKLILDNVSFVIDNGKHYSFVGINGAGKTTITKLITGLYTNYEGEILLDGRSLKNLSQAELKGLSSVVYQDFARYSISLYDNIAVASITDDNSGKITADNLSDVTADSASNVAADSVSNVAADNAGKTSAAGVSSMSPDNKSSMETDGISLEGVRMEVQKAVELLGLSEAVDKLADGLDTYLGKVKENGVDLSGGEWQRIAMARSVISSAPLRILDEPTAALDPIGESMVYKQFEQISKGKTTIFISHRLGSTKLADIIYVIDEGRIAESGTHASLMNKDGIYAKMYQAQAGWYINDADGGTDREMEAAYSG